ncbi:MAG: TetR/AcrR family transcriptional regulator [Hyphomicrobiaceae bacterium]
MGPNRKVKASAGIIKTVNRHRPFTPDRHAIETPLVGGVERVEVRSCGAERSSGGLRRGGHFSAPIDASGAGRFTHGVEGFSLRRVAREAGVSPAAPFHHFGDLKGLLSALAARGYQRLIDAMTPCHMMSVEERPHAMLTVYVDFALGHPALFRLMFSSNRPDYSAPELAESAEASFRLLSDAVTDRSRSLGLEPDEEDVLRAWTVAHGLADLLISNRLYRTNALPAGERRARLLRILASSLRSA